jgi:hypothetical protein
MRIYIFILFGLFSLTTFSQKETIDFTSVDSLYREDQFYVSFSYSNLQKPPQGFNQVKVSPGMSFGFLRDMPINKARTWAIAVGLGYSFNVINHNLGITKTNNQNTYAIINTAYDKNKIALHYVDIPLEIRWRASTPESHKFWRIHSGFKLSYLFRDQYKYVDANIKIKESGNADLNKLQYGTYITAGWNTWNVYAYYGLNPIFKSAKINTVNIDLNAFNLGLMFYIL